MVRVKSQEPEQAVGSCQSQRTFKGAQQHGVGNYQSARVNVGEKKRESKGFNVVAGMKEQNHYFLVQHKRNIHKPK